MALAPGLGDAPSLDLTPGVLHAAGSASSPWIRSLLQIKAEAFTDQEVREGLRRLGVNAHDLPAAVREFLRNPRIFSIATSMLDRINVDELTRERLLFEQLRKRLEERRRSAPHQ